MSFYCSLLLVCHRKLCNFLYRWGNWVMERRVHLLRRMEKVTLWSWLVELWLGHPSSGLLPIPENLRHEGMIVTLCSPLLPGLFIQAPGRSFWIPCSLQNLLPIHTNSFGSEIKTSYASQTSQAFPICALLNGPGPKAHLYFLQVYYLKQTRVSSCFQRSS